jgi:esterase/lipase
LSGEIDSGSLWAEYYEEFPSFSVDTVRAGCHPRILLHEEASGKGIVLVHGLTDSPYFMSAIADYFHNSLGYDVYMPLLQSHGLKEPEGMSGVSLTEWKKNVLFAIRTAAKRADRVSVGGLSTGGALSFYLGCTEQEVDGEIYLFSPALGLNGGRFEIYGRIMEVLLRIRFLRNLDNGKPLAGSNPYRYARVPLNAAAELALLIQKIKKLLRDFEKNRLLDKRIFCAWSECDRVISLRAIRSLEQIVTGSGFSPFVISKDAQVDHACVVLKNPVYGINAIAGDAPLEDANPVFDKMLAAIGTFAAAG